MKKIFIVLTSIVLTFVFGCAIVGCKKTNKKSSNSTEFVVSNGGMAVQKGSTLYFVNEATDNASIYRVETDGEGNFIGEPSVFVSNVVGTESGSLYIFGDYLYYVALSTDRIASGETQSGIVKFFRIPLSGGKAKAIYTSQSSDETSLQYAYYATGDRNLFLVVYEESKKTITSVDIGTRPTKSVIATDVTGVLLAENGNINGANAFVYYTKAKDKWLANQTGNVVEKISPDGTNKTTISTKDVEHTLITIADGKLIYSDGNYIYSSDGDRLSNQDKVLSYLPSKTYEQIKYYGNKLIVLATINSGSTKTYELWQLEFDSNGDLQKTVINDSMDEDAEFVCTLSNKLFYLLDSKIYAIEIGENKTGNLLTDTTVDDILGYIAPETIGKYLYFMHTENGVPSIRRINITAGIVEEAEKLYK